MDGKRKSALLHAIEQGKVETVNFLLDRNANYMMQDDRNQSCLHVAATYNRVTIIEMLLKVGSIELSLLFTFYILNLSMRKSLLLFD